MAQFDIYTNPVKAMRDSHPYVVEIQSSFLQRPIALIGIPVARLEPGSVPVTTLNPRLSVADDTQQYVLETLAIASFEPGELRRPVANLSQDAQAIWDALDYALHGY